MPKNNWNLEVRPRYSAGSPCQIHPSLLKHLRSQELAGYQCSKAGLYSEAERERAVRVGLAGILFRWKIKNGKLIIIEDLLTKDTACVKKLSEYYERFEQKAAT